MSHVIKAVSSTELRLTIVQGSFFVAPVHFISLKEFWVLGYFSSSKCVDGSTVKSEKWRLALLEWSERELLDRKVTQPPWALMVGTKEQTRTQVMVTILLREAGDEVLGPSGSFQSLALSFTSLSLARIPVRREKGFCAFTSEFSSPKAIVWTKVYPLILSVKKGWASFSSWFSV